MDLCKVKAETGKLSGFVWNLLIPKAAESLGRAVLDLTALKELRISSLHDERISKESENEWHRMRGLHWRFVFRSVVLLFLMLHPRSVYKIMEPFIGCLILETMLPYVRLPCILSSCALRQASLFLSFSLSLFSPSSPYLLVTSSQNKSLFFLAYFLYPLLSERRMNLVN